jgi:isoquinoline 1-oxidoreductase subunit beta
MKLARRRFLVGSAVLLGGAAFAINAVDDVADAGAAGQPAGQAPGTQQEHAFAPWLKIGTDGTITLYSPHIDFGQGTHTALAQMLADELDADWSRVRVESAPADPAFANAALVRGFLAETGGALEVVGEIFPALVNLAARVAADQSTAGSTGVRYTGQHGMRVLGASVREAMVKAAARRLGVPRDRLVTADSVVRHEASGRDLSYGELAADAARQSLSGKPRLKRPEEFRFIGKSMPRMDVPAKVDGTAVYGMDLKRPDLRVAVVRASPVAGGKLTRFDQAAAMAVPGVESVVVLQHAIVVVAAAYWPAHQGLVALEPDFEPGPGAVVSSAAIAQAHRRLTGGDRLQPRGFEQTEANGDRSVEAEYQVPCLHQAPMEPLNLTGHFDGGKLTVWGGLQDPLAARKQLAKAANLPLENVRFVPTLMGGGFGRRFPHRCTEIIEQMAQLAPRLPYPVKLIWSREEDFAHCGFRPQVAAVIKATLSAEGKVSSWQSRYAQEESADAAAALPYNVGRFEAKHLEHVSGVSEGAWRSVNHSQHGFFTESMVDELAQLAGQDPLAFRLNHVRPDSKASRVLQALREHAQWERAPAAGVGRGLALVAAMGSMAGMVVEVMLDGARKLVVCRVVTVVDCGLLVNPRNGQAQIEGGVLMGLSAALGEAITFKDGAVQQTSFADYPILRLAQAPKIEVHFIPSNEAPGGLGEPGLPPVAPALCNAIFQLTGKRIRQLPVADQYA